MRLSLSVLIVAALLSAGAASAQTTIDFGPALPGAPPCDWVILTNELAALGATFSTAAPGGVAWVGPTYAWEPARFSITSIDAAPEQPPWGAEPIRVDFAPYVSEASLRGFDNSGDTDVLTIKAFDSGGTLVDSRSVFSPAGVVGWVAASEIAYITFEGSTLIGDGLFFDDLTFLPVASGPQEVSIVVRGGQALRVNPNGNGVLPLVIHGSETLDVEDVDLSSLALGDAAPRERGKSGKTGILADFNGDFYVDLQLQFLAANLGLEPGQTELVLSGMLADGTEIAATVEVSLLGAKALSAPAGPTHTQLVPEPACTLLLVPLAWIIGRRRR